MLINDQETRTTSYNLIFKLLIIQGGRRPQTKVGLILAVTTLTVALYALRRLVLSPIVNRPAAQQQHRIQWVGWVVGWGVLGHYVVTPNLS